jgi:hypothetical protein
MTPAWFPWIFVGGIVFVVLSFIGTKYKDKEYRRIQPLQDFISGSILVAFVGVLAPDLFPEMELPSVLAASLSMKTSEMGKNLYDDDVELQVGPPRLMGR